MFCVFIVLRKFDFGFVINENSYVTSCLCHDLCFTPNVIAGVRDTAHDVEVNCVLLSIELYQIMLI